MLLFISWSCDHIGREIGRHALSDDVEGLRRMSQAIDHGNDIWRSWVMSTGGSLISMDGDEGRAEVPADRIEDLPKVRTQYSEAVGAKVSVGVGVKLGEAEKALMAAKIRGGDKIVFYGQDVDQDLENAQKKPDSEQAKIVDEYLDKSEDGKTIRGEQNYWHVPQGRDRARLDPKLKYGGLEDVASDESLELGSTRGRKLLDKSEPREPRALYKNVTMNQGQGAGFSGASRPQAAAKPVPARAEASEHSQGEGIIGLLNQDRPPAPEGTHAAKDLETQFHEHAQTQEQQDQHEAQAAAQQSDTLKAQVVQVLQAVRQQTPMLEQLKQAAPDAYKAVIALTQSVVALAQQLPTTQPQAPVKKFELAPVIDEEDTTLMKALPRARVVKPPKGYTDRHDHVYQHLLASNPHGGTMRDAVRFGWRQIKPDDYWWPEKPIAIDPHDKAIDTREPASPSDVDRYVQMRLEGSKPPAIVGVLYSDGDLNVLDGAHRLDMGKRTGTTVTGYVGIPKNGAVKSKLKVVKAEEVGFTKAEFAGTSMLAHSENDAASYFYLQRKSEPLGCVMVRKDDLTVIKSATRSGYEAVEGALVKYAERVLGKSVAMGLKHPHLRIPGAATFNPRTGGQTGEIVEHYDGTKSIRQARAGRIKSQDPAGHMTSSREPNSK